MYKLELITHNEQETIDLGIRFSQILPKGITILLEGDLGAGKTTFVRGLAKGLGINEKVQSPTFNIMKLYMKGTRPLIHIDAYRLFDNNVDIGLDEYIGYPNGITVIEWPMFVQDLIPLNNVMRFTITHLENDQRHVIIESEFEVK